MHCFWYNSQLLILNKEVNVSYDVGMVKVTEEADFFDDLIFKLVSHLFFVYDFDCDQITGDFVLTETDRGIGTFA